MNNKQLYIKTFKFSLIRMMLGFVGLLVFAGVTVAGYFIGKGIAAWMEIPDFTFMFNVKVYGSEVLDTDVLDFGIVVAFVFAILGGVCWWLLYRYVGYLYKAGQIAMITKGVTQGELPDDVVAGGKAAVKERFLAVNAYFAVTSAISGIIKQITSSINFTTWKKGKVAVTVTDLSKKGVLSLNTLIEIVLSAVLDYFNYCCLGWVFYNKDQNAFKSTCDGAVIYFLNWRTLFTNTGMVIGLTLASLATLGIGFYLIIGALLPQPLISAEAMAKISTLTTPENARFYLQLGLSGAIWAFVHAAIVQPFILVSVMRKYMDKAKKTDITKDLYDKIGIVSDKFRKSCAKADIKSEG